MISQFCPRWWCPFASLFLLSSGCQLADTPTELFLSILSLFFTCVASQWFFVTADSRSVSLKRTQTVIYLFHLIKETIKVEALLAKARGQAVCLKFYRKVAYRVYIQHRHSFLGRGIRVPPPTCLVDIIRGE
jgi:hypothetical protein